MNIAETLISLSDEKYKDFSAKLIPTVEKDRIIGVRTPELRKLAKSMDGAVAKRFLSDLPHKYHEENMLHGFIIERIKDFDGCINEINAFLPYVDNWAVCDSMSPKALKKNKEALLKHIKKWINSGDTYTVRFGLGMIMSHFLDEDFKTGYLTLAAGIKTEEYYVSMMIAWLFATALAKQYEQTLPFIENNALDTKTHNRAIRKAVESYRVSDEHKKYLKTLKVKENEDA